jgi:NitT/TauT family transport system ATP-binding protein
MPGIQIKDVDFSYQGEKTLQGVSLEVAESDFAAIIGPSGCGKSTLLRLVAGLERPDSGSLLLGGEEIIAPGIDRAMVFQDYSLFPWMSCGENIELALEQAGTVGGRASLRASASEYLELVGLGFDYAKLPGELSGGMRQRAAIARAFAMNSPVLLMDEPFGALDAITRARLQDLLLEMWQNGAAASKTVVFITHDVDEALILANKVHLMGTRPGRILKSFDVDIPRPRSREKAFEDERFQRLRSEILKALDKALLERLDEDGKLKEGEGI